MYLLTWNSDQNQIEACFGGNVTSGEARVFSEELRDLLMDHTEEPFKVLMDYSTTSRLEKEVRCLLEESRETCLFSGASNVTFVTRDEQEADDLTSARIQSVLEGKERYIAFHAVA